MSDYKFKNFKNVLSCRVQGDDIEPLSEYIGTLLPSMSGSAWGKEIMLLLELVCQKVTKSCALFGTDSTKFMQPTANN